MVACLVLVQVFGLTGDSILNTLRTMGLVKVSVTLVGVFDSNFIFCYNDTYQYVYMYVRFFVGGM